jgi:predicted metal-binding protein
MGKTKIGILTCNNARQDLYCSSAMCLHDLREGNSAFKIYRETGGAELLGLITCDGCPTLAAPDRIVKRVKGLVDLGAEAIHMASCMMCACPFRNKYMGVLQAAFPTVKIVPGTHYDEKVDPEEGAKGFQAMIGPMLSQMPEKTMSDVALQLYPTLFRRKPEAD